MKVEWLRSDMKRLVSFRRTSTTFAAIVLTVSLSAGGWAGFLWLTGNVHEISSGVYRSAQLNATHLRQLIHDKSLRTVVNLRGPNPGKPWYDAEVQTTQAAAVVLVSIPMSAIHEPSDALLAQLVKTLRDAERPLLIHCESGADRTGLAAALFELLMNGKSPAEADRQLSFRYGHFPWLLSRSGAMDRTFWAVAK